MTPNTEDPLLMFPAPPDAKDSRIWIDGCFDFTHHGHAGAMLQARQTGKELYVGVHSDEEILRNKGPTVMNLDERLSTVEACRWVTKPIPDAPYVTDPEFMDKYNCKYAVHGDDITTDANGDDCYKIVKDIGRFIVVKRTPSILTTDLVGRMLTCNNKHHLPTIETLDILEIGNKNGSTHPILQEESVSRYKQYSRDETGHHPGAYVHVSVVDDEQELYQMSKGKNLKSFDKIYYVNGDFDLFHPGHIEFLKQVSNKAKSENALVIVGIWDDRVSSNSEYRKETYFPIMSLFERSLCVVQCRYVDGIILGAPLANSAKFFQKLSKSFGGLPISKVITSSVIAAVNGKRKEDLFYDIDNGLLENIGLHKYDDISSESIVKRVLDNRKIYEARQKKKGWIAESL